MLDGKTRKFVMDASLKTSVSNILELNAQLVGQKAKRLGCPEYQILDNNIKSVVEVISDKIPLVRDCSVRVGKGNGYLARVPWIYISKLPGPVSSKVGIAICFCKNGNGVILGKMHPMGILNNQEKRSIRKKEPNFIDVDGASNITRYNNRFVNPFEMYKDKFDIDIFISELSGRIQFL